MKTLRIIKNNLVTLLFLGMIYLLNWVIPESVRLPFYHNLRELDLAGNPTSLLITLAITLGLIFVSIIGWYGINTATDIGIPKLEIATANFTKTLVVVASLSAVLGTIGSSGGEIASAFFEGLRILPDIITHKPVDSAGIFSVYVANFSGVVNASAAAVAGIVLIYSLKTKRISSKQFKEKVRELGAKSTLILATGLFFLYFIQSAVTWDGSPTFSQSLLVVLFGVIVFIYGFNAYKSTDAQYKPKSGRDYLFPQKESFSLHPKRLGSFLALQAIGDSQNLLVVVPKFMLALSALISMLIIPIEFILVMLGFNEVVLAFAVAFITSIVEMLLVITAGEMAIFLLLGSNVIDVIFGLFFGEVLPQMFGHISYHKAMPAVSMYSAIFALATLIGVLVAKKAYVKNKHIFATLLFIVFIIGGSLVYNIAIFFNGIDPMNQLISSYLAIYENPIYYIFWGIVGLYIAVKFVQNQKEKDTILDEVLKSLVELKNYYEGAIFTIQIDAHSLQSHLGKISYLVKHLIDAEKYLGGDGKLSIIIENNIVPDAITKENYQKILTELAHNIPQASPTILTDTLEKLLTKEFVADISLANNSTPLLFISLQSTLTLQDIDNAKKLLETSKQLNNVIFEVGCYDADDTTLEKLNILNEIQTDNVTKTNWVSIIELSDHQNITYILESIFDRFTDYIKELNQKSK